VLVFGTFHYTPLVVPAITWNATKTIKADNTTGIKDMRDKEGHNIF
jgi:hypothetical protein